MKTLGLFAGLLAFLLTAGLPITPAHADKPEWAGGGKHQTKVKKEKKHKNKGENREHAERGDRDRHGDHAHIPFAHEHKVVVREYYDERFHTGKCPPGLAKKRNGCMPPGQAKKWAVGRPLPPNVVYYPLPAVLVTRLPPPPPQHRYVRVAGDILLIAIGSSMVVDAIQDLGRI